MMSKKNKYIYLYVLQGKYENKWEDLVSSEDEKEIMCDKVDYVKNEPETDFRVICRRVIKESKNN